MPRINTLADSKIPKSLKAAKPAKAAKSLGTVKAMKAAKAGAPPAGTVSAKKQGGDHRTLLFQAQRAFMDDPADQVRVSTYRGALARYLPSSG